MIETRITGTTKQRDKLQQEKLNIERKLEQIRKIIWLS